MPLLDYPKQNNDPANLINNDQLVDIEAIHEFIYLADGPLNLEHSNDMNKVNIIQDIAILPDINVKKNYEEEHTHEKGKENDNMTEQTTDENENYNNKRTKITRKCGNNQPINTLTKKGKERKRQTYDVPLQERKRIKKEEKKKNYDVKPPCSEKCIKQCKNIISEQRRHAINAQYWNMTWLEQRQYIINNTQRKDPKKQKINTSRTNTYLYFMKNEVGTSYQICKPFFLTTLGFLPNNDKVVQNVLKNSEEHLSVKPDMRGKNSKNTLIYIFIIIY